MDIHENEFFYPSNVLKVAEQQEQLTQKITGLMAIVIAAAATIIFGGTLAGLFALKDTLPIYILLMIILPAWWWANHGGWKWERLVPVFGCFLLGIFGSWESEFRSIFVLSYALAVILAGMLFNPRVMFGMVFICVLCYTGLGFYREGLSADPLANILTFTFLMIGMALLYWLANSYLQRALEGQIQGNALLMAEMQRREKAEKHLREQATQFDRLVTHVNDVITEIDNRGIIQFATPSYQTVLGYDPQALLGTDAFDMLHPDDLLFAKQIAQESASSREPKRIQVRVRDAHGKYIWFEVSGAPLYDSDERLDGFTLVSRDITQQKRAELKLQESEEKFRKIIEMLPMGVHMYTLQDNGELVFDGYNRAADAILRFDHSELIGKTVIQAFPGLIERGIPERFREIAVSGSTWTQERFDYSYPPINGIFEVQAFQTEPGKMVSIFTDITRRVRAEEELRLSEEKFSTAFITSPDSINMNRLKDGVYVDINQGFTRLTGYTREEVIGKSSLELNIWVDPGDRKRLVEGLLEDGVVENLEAHFRRKNGDIGMGLMSAGVITVFGEKCILSTTRDITDWIQAQVDLREAHAKLERAYEATLKGWARALELRERETADHSRRVVDLTMGIAQRMGIVGDDLVHLQRGALLHDIGKLGVPDEILLKPSSLSTEEWDIMHQHPGFARAMLEEIEYLHPSIPIPFCHHERWDGTGYPAGLQGEEIPLAARIFSVVDVFDALTHDRPYRPAMTEAVARQYLQDQRGKQFDPRIVDLFLHSSSITDESPKSSSS